MDSPQATRSTKSSQDARTRARLYTQTRKAACLSERGVGEAVRDGSSTAYAPTRFFTGGSAGAAAPEGSFAAGSVIPIRLLCFSAGDGGPASPFGPNLDGLSAPPVAISDGYAAFCTVCMDVTQSRVAPLSEVHSKIQPIPAYTQAGHPGRAPSPLGRLQRRLTSRVASFEGAFCIAGRSLRLDLAAAREARRRKKRESRPPPRAFVLRGEHIRRQSCAERHSVWERRLSFQVCTFSSRRGRSLPLQHGSVLYTVLLLCPLQPLFAFAQPRTHRAHDGRRRSHAQRTGAPRPLRAATAPPGA